MFLEYWMIGALGVLLVIAVIVTDKTSSQQGYKRGVEQGAELALKLLEMRGVISVVDDEIVPVQRKKNEEKL